MSIDELIKIKNVQQTFGVLLLLFPTQMSYIMAFKSMLDVFMRENNTDPLYENLRTTHNFLEKKLTELNFNTNVPTETPDSGEGPKVNADYPTFDESKYYDAQLLEKYEELKANAINNNDNSAKEFYTHKVKIMKDRVRRIERGGRVRIPSNPITPL